jgi:4-hydroxy-2-oxoheptanedioate aldolase
VSAGTLRERMRDRQRLLGTFVQTSDPTVVEIVGRAGFDFALVDLEHGGLTQAAIPGHARAADVVDLPLLVRLGLGSLEAVAPALELGCKGILVAQVASATDASRAVAAARFPPDGERGACPGVRASSNGWVAFPDYMQQARAETIVGVAVEDPAAIARLDEIVAVPGLDFVFVGVFDLSTSLGRPGELDHPSVVDAVARVAETADAHGLAMGTWAPDPTVAARWVRSGARILTVGTDVLLWRTACLDVVTAWQSVATVGSMP